MIPETGAVKQVRLYRAVEFPYRWELDSVLLEGQHYVDSSLMRRGESMELICFYTQGADDVTERYELDMKNRCVKRILETKTLCNRRPAGNPFTVGNDRLRPLQNCESYYGQGTLLYRENDDGEVFYGEIHPENFHLMPNHSHLTGTHTINRSEHYEVVDYRYDRFCLSKRLIWLTGKLRNKVWIVPFGVRYKNAGIPRLIHK